MRTGTFYEINISKNGKHILATDSSIREYDEFQIVEMIRRLKKVFPEEEYDYSVSAWHCGVIPLPDRIKRALEKSEK